MNIKLLKLQGWEDKFQQEITKDYHNEQLLMETRRWPNFIVNLANSMFNLLLSMSIFATYVYLGNTMSVSTTTLATIMINRIKGPINRLTNFYQSWLDNGLSLEKIHEFLCADETQPNVKYSASAETDGGS